MLLAVGFNVDSIQVAKTLWLDRDARQDMVNAASEYMKSHQPPADSGSKGEIQLNQLQKNVQTSVEAFKNVSTAALMPVGWNGTFQDNITRLFSTWETALSSIGGWLITAVALSLGAPFWFDTLNRFMVVRSTIKPQEKSLPEPSKN